MNPPDLPKPVIAEPLFRTLALSGGLLVLGDFLMWDRRPGLGLAIFAMLIGIVLFAQGSRTKRAWAALALLAGSCVQGTIDLCLTNVCLTPLLLAILLGESHYVVLPAGWARWLEGMLAWLKGLGRWLWVIQECFNTSRWSGGGVSASGANFMRLLQIGTPAVILLGIFAVVLSNGNALLAHEFNLATKSFIDWLSHLDFSVGRLLFWFCVGTLALVAVRPASPASQPRSLARAPGTWVRSDVGVAFWQSILILGSLNALFLVVNTLDAAFLWIKGTIPEGVSAYEYIHSGTNSLITATVLSGIVLTAIFQQQDEISRRGLLRALAHVWIVQNLVLLGSVALRLKLFYELSLLLTDTRIHLALFLVLVALGFGFLIFHIERGPNLRLLMWRNACAAFVLLYTVQFINTTGLAARWNVSQWAAASGQGFGLSYLKAQGPDAWPALVQLATSRNANGQELPGAAEALRESAEQARKRLRKQDWRERQFRYDAHARNLIAADDKLQVN